MQRYFVHLAYNGTHYHGWQVQPNAISVQQVLNESFRTYLRDQTINFVGCGRTDTGVHATNFYAHFETSTPFEEEELAFRINRLLPKDIVVYRVFSVSSDQHTRFDATSRTYQYFIHQQKNPFLLETSYLFIQPLDLDVMNRGGEVLKKYNDFTSFSKLHTETRTNLCDLAHAHWEQKNDQLVFTITANRFLRNMVRAVVGTLLDLGQKKYDLDELRKKIEAKDRGQAGRSVPGHALFLTDIRYPYL